MALLILDGELEQGTVMGLIKLVQLQMETEEIEYSFLMFLLMLEVVYHQIGMVNIWL